MKCLHRYKVMILLLFLFSLELKAQENQGFHLEDVQKYAVEHNRDVRKADLSIEAAFKQIGEVRGIGLPQVELSASYRYMLDIPTQLIPGEIFGGEPGSTIPVKFGKPQLANVGVSISQLLFSGSYLVGLSASRVYLQLSERNKRRTELDVKAMVTDTYYLILIAEESRNILRETLKNLEQTKSEVTELNNEGLNEQADVKQIQITYNAVDNGIKTLDQQIEIAYKLIKYQMGLPLDQKIRLLDDLEAVISSIDIEVSLGMMFDPDSNINIQMMETQVNLADLSLSNEKRTFLPTLAGFVSFQRDAQRDKFDLFNIKKDWFPTSVIGVQLNWPVFSGSTKIYKVQKARIEYEQAKLDLENAREGMLLQHSQAHGGLVAARDRYLNARTNRDLALDVYEFNLQKYREGLISSLELTQGHNQYLDAERTYLENLSTALTALTQLKKILETL
jgi:outer membrane protein